MSTTTTAGGVAGDLAALAVTWDELAAEQDRIRDIWQTSDRPDRVRLANVARGRAHQLRACAADVRRILATTDQE